MRATWYYRKCQAMHFKMQLDLANFEASTTPIFWQLCFWIWCVWEIVHASIYWHISSEQYNWVFSLAFEINVWKHIDTFCISESVFLFYIIESNKGFLRRVQKMCNWNFESNNKKYCVLDNNVLKTTTILPFLVLGSIMNY